MQELVCLADLRQLQKMESIFCVYLTKTKRVIWKDILVTVAYMMMTHSHPQEI